MTNQITANNIKSINYYSDSDYRKYGIDDVTAAILREASASAEELYDLYCDLPDDISAHDILDISSDLLADDRKAGIIIQNDLIDPDVVCKFLLQVVEREMDYDDRLSDDARSAVLELTAAYHKWIASVPCGIDDTLAAAINKFMQNKTRGEDDDWNKWIISDHTATRCAEMIIDRCNDDVITLAIDIIDIIGDAPYYTDILRALIPADEQ